MHLPEAINLMACAIKNQSQISQLPGRAAFLKLGTVNAWPDGTG